MSRPLAIAKCKLPTWFKVIVLSYLILSYQGKLLPTTKAGCLALIVYNPGTQDTVSGTLFGGTLMVKMMSAGHLLTVDVVGTRIISRPKRLVIQRAVMRVSSRKRNSLSQELL